MELYSGGTLVGIALGEVGHSRLNYAMPQPVGTDYQSACTRAYAYEWANLVLPLVQLCDNNGSNFSGLRPREYLCAVGH